MFSHHNAQEGDVFCVPEMNSLKGVACLSFLLFLTCSTRLPSVNRHGSASNNVNKIGGHLVYRCSKFIFGDTVLCHRIINVLMGVDGRPS